MSLAHLLVDNVKLSYYDEMEKKYFYGNKL